MPATAHVLVVDDEPMVREVVARYLRRDGHEVTELGDGTATAAWLREHRPDLVVLDVMLPGRDGLDILRTLRRDADVPVILLTARAEVTDRIVGLELGADDYVVKPFSPRELAVRVAAVLRRTRPPTDAPLRFGALTIDPPSREVTVSGRVVELTPKEYDLLELLARNPRRVLSRDQLLREVWDATGPFQDPSTVTVHVRRLRAKIESDPTEPHHIRTVWGVGYRFEP